MTHPKSVEPSDVSSEGAGDPGSEGKADPSPSPRRKKPDRTPENLAPGVYVEEDAFRSRIIRGACTIPADMTGSDPEWKYVTSSRYFTYLEDSIGAGTQWVVFEPNGPELWKVVHRSIEDFLSREWKLGRLQGENSEEAYFVRCDRTTMTENDIDFGRLICIVGVAPSRPAEFVIFRVSQNTIESIR